jgi:hypothetical protein
MTMTVKLHRPGYDHAIKLIEDGHVVLDERDAWSEHQPSAQAENAFIEQHGYGEYGRWHLGVDDEANPETKGRYSSPTGTSATSTDAPSWPPSHGRPSATTPTSSRRPRTCTA